MGVLGDEYIPLASKASLSDIIRSGGLRVRPRRSVTRWMTGRLPEYMRLPRLTEADRYGGEYEYAIRSADSIDPFIEGSDLSPTLDEIYRYLRRRGYRKGGLACCSECAG
jgi:hypothetical protein